MATKKTAAGYEFIVAQLRKNKHAVYADIKAKADKKNLPVFPIMYGRAKAALGLIPSKKPGRKAGKRGPGRPKKASGRGPGRPRKVATGSKSDRVRELLAAGMAPGEIAKKVGCSRNLVYLLRSRAAASGTRGTRGPGRPRKVVARGPGRPKKAVAQRGRGAGVDGPLAAVQDLISNLEDHARENARMREALEQIGRMIDRVV